MSKWITQITVYVYIYIYIVCVCISYTIFNMYIQYHIPFYVCIYMGFQEMVPPLFNSPLYPSFTKLISLILQLFLDAGTAPYEYENPLKSLLIKSNTMLNPNGKRFMCIPIPSVWAG